MSYAGRLLCFLVVSGAFHLMLARGAQQLPAQPSPRRPAVVQVELRPPPPPVRDPEPEPEPQPETVRVDRRQLVAPRLQRSPVAARPERIEVTEAPTERPSPGAQPAQPTFGISMDSTSRAGTGPVLPTGNTLQVRPGGGRGAAPVKPLPPPVGAHQVTRLPVPQGRCSGRYTEAARQAGLEGTVVLDLVVGEDGRVREVTVVRGLGAGLNEAAIAALKGCRFSPGERDGRAVPVKLRGFKIRFFLQGGD